VTDKQGGKKKDYNAGFSRYSFYQFDVRMKHAATSSVQASVHGRSRGKEGRTLLAGYGWGGVG